MLIVFATCDEKDGLKAVGDSIAWVKTINDEQVVDSFLVRKGYEFTLPESDVEQKDGYVFLWQTDNDSLGTVYYSPKTKYEINNSVVFYGTWHKEYLIKFISDGKTIDSVCTIAGQKITFPALDDSYVWSANNAENFYNPNTEYLVNASVFFYAVKKGGEGNLNGDEDFLIKFISDGQTVNSIFAKNGDKISLPTLQNEKDGYDFLNWSTSDGSTYNPNAEYIVNSSVEFYAVWDEKEYMIKFISDGQTVNSISAKFGERIQIPSLDIEKDGYDFLNWSTSDGSIYNPNTEYVVNSSAEFYAVWDEKDDGIHDYELESFLANCKDFNKVYDVKIIDLKPDFGIMRNAMQNHSDIQVNLNLKKCTEVTSIEDDAFRECSNMIDIDLPESVTIIGTNSFYGCTNLSSIIIPKGVAEIGMGAFFNCSNLATIVFPEKISCISSYTFMECSSLSSVNIPEGVTSIGELAFSGCISLSSVKLPESLTALNGFSHCSSLTSIDIPYNVTYVGDFDGCTSLTSIIFPENVTQIGDFNGCTGLTSIIFPENVNYIGNFNGCTSLTSIIIPENVTYIGSFGYCTSLTSIDIPKSVTSFGGFEGCSSLTSINLSESITQIGISAFAGCSSLTSINLPESITIINMSAFSDCSSLTTIIIPENVNLIGNYTFRGCSSLTTLTIKSTNPPSLGLWAENNWIDYDGTINVPMSAVEAYKNADGWRSHANQIVGY